MRRALLLALALAACSRPPAPSPEYAEARRRHAELVAAHPGDAAARPEIDAVLQLLAEVPASSADAPAAAELRARIEAERKTHGEEASRRGALVARAARPGAMPAASPVASPAAAPAIPAAPARPAGGVQLLPGAKLEELRARGGDCFEKKTDVEIAEGAKRSPGEAWGLKDGAACAAKHPAQAGQWLLFADGRYVSTEPSASAVTVKREVPAAAKPSAPEPTQGAAR